MLNGAAPVSATADCRRAGCRRSCHALSSDGTPGRRQSAAQPLSAGTILVLMAAGVLSALVLYALDIYGMLI